MSKVSIIIATYNYANYIADAINSVLCQTYCDFEIIVVDDGSTDNTFNILKSFNDERIKYFYKENGGVSSALNYGMARALGDYIAFLGADDIWCPTKLENQISVFNKNKDVGIVSCDVQIFNSYNKNMGIYRISLLYPKNEFNLYNFLRHSLLVPSSVVIRKKVMDDVGFFRSDFDSAEDFEYFLRVLTKYHLMVVDKVLVKYRIGHPSLSTGFRAYHARERILDDFFNKTSDDRNVNLSLAKKDAYYGLYYNHGKDLLWKGRTREARQYFIKALTYKKTLRVIWLFLKSYVKDALIIFGFFRNRNGRNR